MLLRLTLTIAVPDDADIDQIEPLVVRAGRQAMARTLDLACREVEQTTPVACPHCAGTAGAWDGIDPRVVLARRRWHCRGWRQRGRRVEDLNTAWDRAHEPRLYSA